MAAGSVSKECPPPAGMGQRQGLGCGERVCVPGAKSAAPGCPRGRRARLAGRKTKSRLELAETSNPWDWIKKNHF